MDILLQLYCETSARKPLPFLPKSCSKTNLNLNLKKNSQLLPQLIIRGYAHTEVSSGKPHHGF